ncbi:MAG: outer membrane protein assembly factor BamE [Panacagrimonas sp.]
MRVLLLSLLLVSLCGCQLIYKLPTRQGNVLEQKDLNKLKTGMTRDQVKFVLGTPLAATPFRKDRWDYVGYYKSPRGEIVQRTVTAFFDGDQLARLEGVEEEKGDKALSSPDVDEVLDAEERDKAEARRSAEENDPGVILNPDTRRP